MEILKYRSVFQSKRGNKGALLILMVLMCGCDASRKVVEETVLYINERESNPMKNSHEDLERIPLLWQNPEEPSTIVIDAPIWSKKEAQRLLQRKKRSAKHNRQYGTAVSPVALKIVENYENSENKEPGGHCLAACRSRFLTAYKDVHGTSVYNDLPSDMATKYYRADEVFDHLYASTFGAHKGWRTLPKKYRGRGGAGAVAHAGMGTLVDWFGIWSGKLRPGAIMQVWKRKSDYNKVIRGKRGNNFDPFGHSFIFLGYERDTAGKIIGLNIADQGYQSYRPLRPRDYEVWWGANLNV
ncbi:Hypothetical protein I595_1759 [Croceitalea dokdonensis DOKDO 023]|uniref:Uncharacterized protein n=1 Tax=Croceitalea dokdonensis DOKDO 023 TaxID=1300341 RepID=A0A0P7A612_9FLAO|nr:hypothetical protein [Croceitalea dokdonensis]KPM32110.1 Hypothetical protein I595_1759 [Croceitalea dokdonensis DOKDO 023]